MFDVTNSFEEYEPMNIIFTFRVNTWGWGVHGQLGQGGTNDLHQPTILKYHNFLEVSKVAAGCGHSVILTKQVTIVFV